MNAKPGDLFTLRHSATWGASKVHPGKETLAIRFKQGTYFEVYKQYGSSFTCWVPEYGVFVSTLALTNFYFEPCLKR